MKTKFLAWLVAAASFILLCMFFGGILGVEAETMNFFIKAIIVCTPFGVYNFLKPKKDNEE